MEANLVDLLRITYDSVALPLSGYSLKESSALLATSQLEESGGES